MGSGRVGVAVGVLGVVVGVLAIYIPVQIGRVNDFNQHKSSCLAAIEVYSTNVLAIGASTSAYTSTERAEDLRDELAVERLCFTKELIDPSSKFVESWSSSQYANRTLYGYLHDANALTRKVGNDSVQEMIANSDIARKWVQKQEPPGWLLWVERPVGAPEYDYDPPEQ